MKKVILILFALMLAGGAMAQVPKVQSVDNEVYVVVETDPQYPGGDEALRQYIGTNLKYPEKAKEEKIEGYVYVTFIVEKDGTVTNVKVLRDIGGGCGEEAVRVVRAMPKWKPGQVQGKPVRVQYTLPLVFSL